MSPAVNLVETLETEYRTELARLGSSRSLYAETAGDIEEGPVLAAAATAEYAAWQTFADWAETESDDGARELFERATSDEEDHYEAVVELLAEDATVDELVPPLQAHLRTLEDTERRVGGFLGRTLASRRSTEQVIGFFVGNADPATADVFRGFVADLDAQRDAAVEVADDHPGESVLSAAREAIEVAYDEYVDSLESLGVNPKPVC